MNILIVSTSSKLSQSLVNVLEYYFAPVKPKNSSSITIDTKYYTCSLDIKISDFSQLTGTQEKVESVIFIFDAHEEIIKIKESVDKWIDAHQPELTVLCVDGDIGDEWKYQKEISECQNIVPIINGNFQHTPQKYPKRIQGGLLQLTEEQDPILSLLEMMESTCWSDQIQKVQLKPRQDAINLKQAQSLPKEEQKQQLQEQQLNEQDLQKQMEQFESIMSQMMQVKAMTGEKTGKNDQKRMAEDVILKFARLMGE